MSGLDPYLTRIREIVAQVFAAPFEELSAQTTAADVAGWDSVSHAMLVFEIEDAFKVELDFEATMIAPDLGSLAALVGEKTAGAAPRELPALVVFGNCQAESLAACITHLPAVAGRFDVHFVQSFSTPESREKTVIRPQVLAKCTLLLEQSTPMVKFGQRELLPPECRIVTFPSLDFNLLWPLHANDPRNRPEPGFEYGRYSYGDRIINAVVAEGLTGDAAWATYLLKAAEALRNLDRFESIERRRWEVLDRGMSVPMGAEIFKRFRTERLFYTYNHPTTGLLCHLGAGLARAAGLFEGDHAAAYEQVRRLFTWEFGANYAVPIHPIVGRHFNLTWWTPEMEYRQAESMQRFEPAIRRQIDWVM